MYILYTTTCTACQKEFNLMREIEPIAEVCGSCLAKSQKSDSQPYIYSEGIDCLETIQKAEANSEAYRAVNYMKMSKAEYAPKMVFSPGKHKKGVQWDKK